MRLYLYLSFFVVVVVLLLSLRVALVVANLSHFYFDFALIFRTAAAFGGHKNLSCPSLFCLSIVLSVRISVCVCRCVSVFNAKWRVEFVVALFAVVLCRGQRNMLGQSSVKANNQCQDGEDDM